MPIAIAYAETLLAGLFGDDRAPSAPATFYAGLVKDTGVEPAVGSYARVAVPNTSAYWQPSSSQYVTNIVPIVWPTPTADWGTIAKVALYATSTGTSSIVLDQAMPDTLLVLSGYPVELDVNNLQIEALV